MVKPKVFGIFTQKEDFCEKSSKKPCKAFVPHQAMDLKELVTRFENGQRLGVKENFRIEDEFTRNCVYEERFDDAAPDDVHDVVDVEQHYRAHQSHKSEYAEKKKRKQAPSEKKTPTPPDPAKVESMPEDENHA
jgi:hypothetical protein